MFLTEGKIIVAYNVGVVIYVAYKTCGCVYDSFKAMFFMALNKQCREIYEILERLEYANSIANGFARCSEGLK